MGWQAFFDGAMLSPTCEESILHLIHVLSDVLHMVSAGWGEQPFPIVQVPKLTLFLRVFVLGSSH